MKAGDKVICKKDYGVQLTKGKQYTVASIHKYRYCGDSKIRVDILADDRGLPDGWDSMYFELATENKTEFKVGDIVICNADYPNQFTKGRAYTVARIVGLTGDNETIYVKANDRGTENGWHSKYFYKPENSTSQGECDHHWKIYRGFSFDDEYCEKCQAKRKLSA
jgi:hypothetical protein